MGSDSFRLFSSREFDRIPSRHVKALLKNRSLTSVIGQRQSLTLVGDSHLHWSVTCFSTVPIAWGTLRCCSWNLWVLRQYTVWEPFIYGMNKRHCTSKKHVTTRVLTYNWKFRASIIMWYNTSQVNEARVVLPRKHTTFWIRTTRSLIDRSDTF